MGKRRFQQRFIAFVDVLGFGSIVKRMSGDDRLSSEVFQPLRSFPSNRVYHPSASGFGAFPLDFGAAAETLLAATITARSNANCHTFLIAISTFGVVVKSELVKVFLS